MAVEFSSQQVEEYVEAGLTVLHGVIPASLLTDLRRETDKAREIARREHGSQVQRLQPVYAYDELDDRVFRDFLQLPRLRIAVDQILGRDHEASDIMGVFFEPMESPWCTNWHRDHHNVDTTWMADGQLAQAIRNPRMFNQLNAALYDDSSLWVVPGSHDRDDTPEEIAAFGEVPPPAPDLPDEPIPRELACQEYCRRMPGATPVFLFAGDIALYRNTGWHFGNYVPYRKRATLHDGFYGPEDKVWTDVVFAEIRPS